MERGEKVCRAHVMLFPFPAQGHMSPMLQFAKRLASKGLKITVVTTIFMSKFVQPDQSSSVTLETISDGFDDAPTIENFDAYKECFEAIGSQSLARLIEEHKSAGNPVKCLVYDQAILWAYDVAKGLGISTAQFFTQACAVTVIYYHAYHGMLRTPLEGPLEIPGMPKLEIQDLPSFIHVVGLYQNIKHGVLNLFSNYEKADWLLFNSFYMLEDEVVNWMTSQWPIKTVGPTIPSMYLDKRLEYDKDYGLCIFKPNVEACMKWLDTKEIGSVVYVSFGSLANLGEEQMEELARGLIRSNSYFLWVVRASEESKLSSNLMGESSEKCLIVNWCPQLEVLAHQAVGCFVTHCGWNSTLEALSLGVPMVAMPQWTDQTTNAKFIVDVWKAGVRAKVDEKGVVTREEIEMCIKEVMKGERGTEIKSSAVRWKELAKEAVDEGGSSDKNIDEFVSQLVCS